MFATEIIGNFAYIDNQNLYMATQRADDPWDIDMRRFRVYLKEKYNVVKAYLFMGAFELSHQEMYSRFNDYGYALVFREHSESLKGKKKGNHEAKDEKIGGVGSLGISPFAPRSVVTSP